MKTPFWVRIAEALYSERQGLRPLENPAEVQTFNAIREISAEICATLDRIPGFDHEVFINIVMTGKVSE